MHDHFDSIMGLIALLIMGVIALFFLSISDSVDAWLVSL